MKTLLAILIIAVLIGWGIAHALQSVVIRAASNLG